MKNKLKLLSLSIILSLFSSAALADNYDWIVRMRSVYVKADTNSTVSGLGGTVTASSDQTPEIDFTRFFTPNIAAELILATSKHNMGLNGSSAGNKQGLGSVKLLPPTLTLQYHFRPDATFRPYAGAGLNYTIFYGAKTGGIATDIKYQNHLGYALQAGFDYMINDRFGINFDVKKVFLRTRAQVNNTYTAKVNLDPWFIGTGISYRF